MAGTELPRGRPGQIGNAIDLIVQQAGCATAAGASSASPRSTAWSTGGPDPGALPLRADRRGRGREGARAPRRVRAGAAPHRGTSSPAVRISTCTSSSPPTVPRDPTTHAAVSPTGPRDPGDLPVPGAGERRAGRTGCPSGRHGCRSPGASARRAEAPLRPERGASPPPSPAASARAGLRSRTGPGPGPVLPAVRSRRSRHRCAAPVAGARRGRAC